MTVRTRLARLERVAGREQGQRCPKCGRAALGPPAPPDAGPSPEELGAMPLAEQYAAYREMLKSISTPVIISSSMSVDSEYLSMRRRTSCASGGSSTAAAWSILRDV